MGTDVGTPLWPLYCSLNRICSRFVYNGFIPHKKDNNAYVYLSYIVYCVSIPGEITQLDKQTSFQITLTGWTQYHDMVRQDFLYVLNQSV